MNGISIKKGRILFYGNTAGYVDGGKAVVDPIFHCEELKDYLTVKKGLTVQWTDGVYDRLANSKPDMDGNAPVLKACRIHQLKPESCWSGLASRIRKTTAWCMTDSWKPTILMPSMRNLT